MVKQQALVLILCCAGNDHSCAVDTSGAIVCWGLTEGAVSGAPTSGTYTDIAAGRFHSCPESSGGVVCWGVIIFLSEYDSE